ncbi:MAG: thymidine kinase [Erysipelotrichales bacterium]|nr:thymidine kinase [Erysipelotrichales bacterium]
MEQVSKTGWIEIICGPMFAGKSEELIRRVKRLEYAKKNTLVFKPKMDNRYSEDEIVSHSKLHTKSINIEKASDIYKYIKSGNKIDAIVIDEVQFLDSEIVEICSDLADKGIRVIAAGLDMDFRGEPFKNVPELLAKAEYITKLTAICVKCGAPATMTQRIVNGEPAKKDDPIVIVGASECYEPRCRHCHELKNSR